VPFVETTEAQGCGRFDADPLDSHGNNMKLTKMLMQIYEHRSRGWNPKKRNWGEVDGR